MNTKFAEDLRDEAKNRIETILEFIRHLEMHKAYIRDVEGAMETIPKWYNPDRGGAFSGAESRKWGWLDR